MPTTKVTMNSITVEIIRDIRLPRCSDMFVPSVRIAHTRIVRHPARRAYSTLRMVIALVVLACCVWAAIKAVNQLRLRNAELVAQLAEIDTRLAETVDSLEHEQLIAAHALHSSQLLQPRNFDFSKLAGAGLCYAVAVLFSGSYWWVCLRAFGQRPPLNITLAAHAYGQMGKYVPGKAMVVVLRSSAIKRHAGVEMIPAVIGVFIETLTMMACGAAWAGVATLFLPAPSWIRLLAIGLAAGAAVPTLPPLFRLVLKRLERSRFGRELPQANHNYDYGLMVRGWMLMSVVWLLIGLSFWMITLATPGVSTAAAGFEGWATATATIALALVAGFLSLIPGGAGVREIVITALLAPLAGAGPAMVAAILARLMFLAVEALLAGISFVWLGRRPSISEVN